MTVRRTDAELEKILATRLTWFIHSGGRTGIAPTLQDALVTAQEHEHAGHPIRSIECGNAIFIDAQQIRRLLFRLT